jgi:hypothetical protein
MQKVAERVGFPTAGVPKRGQIVERRIRHEAGELVNFTGNGPLRIGVPSDVVGARAIFGTTRWSVTFHDHL